MVDMCEVTGVSMGRGSKFVILAPPRKIAITADTKTDQSMWIDVLEKHRGLVPQARLPSKAAAAGLPPPPRKNLTAMTTTTESNLTSELRQSELHPPERVSQFMELDTAISDGVSTLAAWMEVAEVVDGEEPDFNLKFIALLADCTLGCFNDAGATNGPPIKKLELSKGMAIEPMEEPQYNYEHAFEVSNRPVGNAWLLCPDSPDESERWMDILGKIFG